MNLKQGTAARDVGLQYQENASLGNRSRFKLTALSQSTPSNFEETFRNHVRSGYLRSLSCLASEANIFGSFLAETG